MLNQPSSASSCSGELSIATFLRHLLTVSSHRTAHNLTPNTARELIEQFSLPLRSGLESPGSESPDSLYSHGTPAFPDQAFEYDTPADLEVEERDEDEYESIIDSTSAPSWDSSSWGRRWPEAGLEDQGGWTPSPKAFFTPNRREASIISISPRGSLSALGSTSAVRPVTPTSKLRSDENRRGSNPSLLGFDLAQRRSSSRSQSSRGRESSVQSNNSMLDTVEEQRLRNFADMDLIRRRFSEAVEVTRTPEQDHPMMARMALLQLQSPWSPDVYSDDEDSEVMTAPYVPTPDMPRRPPTLLSNYPLSTAVRADTIEPSTPESSARASPAGTSSFPLPSKQPLLTPPPPTQPIDILKARKKPVHCFDVNYQFPPRSAGVPEGAGPPRPTLNRATTMAIIPSAENSKPVPPKLRRAVGSFPSMRDSGLGISPLHTLLRSDSVASAESMNRAISMDSKNSGFAPPISTRRDSTRYASSPQSSTSTDARGSFDMRRDSSESRLFPHEGRPSSVAERRISIVMGMPMRKVSGDLRRTSSITSGPEVRRTSRPSSCLRRGSAAGSSKSTNDRRTSASSRKSSVVSVSEYGYLGPQIDSNVANASSVTPANTPPRLRSNAPASISLPSPFRAPISGGQFLSPSASTRFNPLESFLGIMPLATPSPPTPDVFTPRMETGMLDEETPRPSWVSIMDRARPISPPEYRYPFPARPQLPPSSPSYQSQTGSASGSDTQNVEASRLKRHSCTPDRSGLSLPVINHESSPNSSGPRLGVVRKAVPQLTVDELQRAQSTHKATYSTRSPPAPHALNSRSLHAPVRRFERRGAIEQFTSGDESLPRPSAHRRTISVQDYHLQQNRRPELPHHMTFDQAYTVGPIHTARFADLPSEPQAPVRPRLKKQSSVAFLDADRVSRPVMQRAASSSSFSRFFHSKSSKSSLNPAHVSPAGPLKSALKPTGADEASSSGSERTLVEVKDLMSKLMDRSRNSMNPGSPRSPKDRTSKLYGSR